MKKKKTNKVTLEAIAGLIEKSSEDAKKFVREHVSGEIEKLAVLVVNRFDQVDERFDKVDERFDKVDGRLDNVEGGIKDLNSRITGIEYGQFEIQKKLDISATHFEIGKIESKFERRFQKIEAKIGMKQKAK